MTKARISDLQITSPTQASHSRDQSFSSGTNEASLNSQNPVVDKAPYPGPNPEGSKAGSLSAVSIQRPRNKEHSWKDAVYPTSSRYYGPTSFSAVFLEHKTVSSEDVLELGEMDRPHPGAWKFGQPLCKDFFPYHDK